MMKYFIFSSLKSCLLRFIYIHAYIRIYICMHMYRNMFVLLYAHVYLGNAEITKRYKKEVSFFPPASGLLETSSLEDHQKKGPFLFSLLLFRKTLVPYTVAQARKVCLLLLWLRLFVYFCGLEALLFLLLLLC